MYQAFFSEGIKRTKETKATKRPLSLAEADEAEVGDRVDAVRVGDSGGFRKLGGDDAVTGNGRRHAVWKTAWGVWIGAGLAEMAAACGEELERRCQEIVEAVADVAELLAAAIHAFDVVGIFQFIDGRENERVGIGMTGGHGLFQRTAARGASPVFAVFPACVACAELQGDGIEDDVGRLDEAVSGDTDFGEVVKGAVRFEREGCHGDAFYIDK